jgi:penicillin-binding protein 1C
MSHEVISIIYPDKNQTIIPTLNIDGVMGAVIFRAAHRKPENTIYWHIDDEFMGSTQNFHELDISLSSGEHVLYLIDEIGNETKRTFSVVLPN